MFQIHTRKVHIKRAQTAIFVFISKLKHKPKRQTIGFEGGFYLLVYWLVVSKQIDEDLLRLSSHFRLCGVAGWMDRMHMHGEWSPVRFWRIDRKMMCSGIMYNTLDAAAEKEILSQFIYDLNNLHGVYTSYKRFKLLAIITRKAQVNK